MALSTSSIFDESKLDKSFLMNKLMNKFISTWLELATIS